MKYAGIDYGKRRTGVAVSDDAARVAVTKETIEASGQDEVIARIKAIVDEDDINIVVVGMPVNMDGESTEMTAAVERFVEKLRNHLTIPVQTTDERLTTEMAKQLLRGVDQKDRDQVAAQILLQNFLDQQQT